MRRVLHLLLLAIVVSSCSTQKLEVTTSEIQFNIDSRGYVTSINYLATDKEYMPEGVDAPLLSLRIDSTYYRPISAEWIDNSSSATITLSYEGDRSAVVDLQKKGDYFTLEVRDVKVNGGEYLDLVLWGSLSTTISKVVGECVGVVRDGDFAFGIRSLNPKTIGGYPIQESDIDPAYDIFATNSITDVADSVKVLYRGHTAQHTDYGSKLHAYTRNRSKERVIAMWGHDHYTAPAFDDGGVVGSKIAIFGSAAQEALEYLEKIVVGEGMPYPQIGGEWNKTSPTASQAYIIYPFNEKNIDKALAFTQRTGLKYLYHAGPFSTWGHFELNPSEFPSGVDGLKKCVEIAAKEGIKLGVHTLSNFTTPNDKYVSPVPDSRLAKVGSSTLVGDVSASQSDIEIASPLFFNQMGNNSMHAVMVGQELIRYESVSDSAPWILQGCERGAWGTKASSHSKDEQISKLIDHAYKVFLTDIDLTGEQARNIASIFNETGIEQISFDGLEGAWSTGLGQYGLSLMMKEWWDALDPERRNNINDASMTTHYNWYIFTRMNWGEPWYGSFRESQVSYRLMNQDFYRRNLIPCMLGWFKYDATTSIEDLEWLLTRSAAFDAGYTLSISSESAVSENGASDRLVAAIASWERARLSGAFPKELKHEMESTDNEYTLEELSASSWNLYPYSISRFSHKNFERQPGEPSITKWKFNNPYDKQPIGFILKADDDISNMELTIAGYSTIEIALKMKKGEFIKYEGGDKITLYDSKWNKRGEMAVDKGKLTVPKGECEITFGCQFSVTDSEKSLSAEIKTKGEAIPLKSTREIHN